MALEACWLSTQDSSCAVPEWCSGAGSAHHIVPSLFLFHQADSDLSVQPCCSGNVRLKSFKASNINANRWWGLIASADGDVAARNAVLQLLKKITQRRWAATVNRKCASVTQSWMSRWCSRARLPSYLLLFRPQGCECTFIFLLRWFIFNTTVWWLMAFIRVQTPKWHFLT